MPRLIVPSVTPGPSRGRFTRPATILPPGASRAPKGKLLARRDSPPGPALPCRRANGLRLHPDLHGGRSPPASIIPRASSRVHHPASIDPHPSTVIHPPASINRHPSTAIATGIHRPAFSDHHPASIHRPASQPASIDRHPPTGIDQPFSISVIDPPSSIPPSTGCRCPTFVDHPSSISVVASAIDPPSSIPPSDRLSSINRVHRVRTSANDRRRSMRGRVSFRRRRAPGRRGGARARPRRAPRLPPCGWRGCPTPGRP